MRRTPLTAESAFAEAVELADADGIGAVTMRRLAQRLGVEAMSLYHHVPNKEAILDGMVDRVYAEVVLPQPGDPWLPAMRDRAVSLRDAMLRHPWSVALLDSRRTPGPGTLRHHEGVIGCLRTAGFSLELTAHAFSLIDAYVFGFAVQQVQLPFDSPEETRVVAEEIAATLTAEFPHLAEFAAGHVMQPGYDYAAEFDYGLDLVLDGLRRAHPTPA